MPDKLKIYTVYDHPKDYPNNYVIRGYTIDGKPLPDEEPLLFTNLDVGRQLMEAAGKTRISRAPEDDPCIVESWL
jgi:hypothetical protein